MGNCSSGCKTSGDKSNESIDPPVADVDSQPTSMASITQPDTTSTQPPPSDPHPAPITVDLNQPAVDVNAPLSERDIDLVQQTFARAALIGAENVGWVLFMNIFEIAPEAKGLFPFKDEDVGRSSRMKAHAGRVVSTVATAISLLRDLPTLVPILQALGLKHVGYGVIPAHYDVVGQALIKSLNTALGDKMTPAVTNAYLKVFSIVKKTMIEKSGYKNIQ